MDFKPMSEITEDELKMIIERILGVDLVEIKSIDKDFEENELIVTILSKWQYIDDCGKEQFINAEEEIIFGSDDIKIDGIDCNYEYQQYTVAKGYSKLWKDNPYL